MIKNLILFLVMLVLTVILISIQSNKQNQIFEYIGDLNYTSSSNSDIIVHVYKTGFPKIPIIMIGSKIIFGKKIVIMDVEGIDYIEHIDCHLKNCSLDSILLNLSNKIVTE